MPITFGSVGDIISISLLIKSLVKSLDNSRGSSTEYQAVIRELLSLDQAILEVEVLFRSCQQTVELNGLIATANECIRQCQTCIIKFQEQTNRFKRNLQNGGSDSRIKDAAFKLWWQISEKERLAKFRAEIAAHFFSLDMLLTTTGITLNKLNHENLQACLEQAELARGKTSTTQTSDSADIKKRLEENTTLVKAALSETERLGLKIDFRYLKNLGANILSYTRRMLSVMGIILINDKHEIANDTMLNRRINLKTYEAVVTLQSILPAQLGRCWTQEPVIFEDALGRVTPIHVEFLDSWEAFHAVLEVRFRELPGHRRIERKEYALRSSLMRKDIDQADAFTKCFLPGQRIDMSMVFNGGPNDSSSCPGCRLVTAKTEEELDSQVQCPGCGLHYQRIMEATPAEPIRVDSLIESTQMVETLRPTKSGWYQSIKDKDEPAQFRRVRLRYWDIFDMKQASTTAASRSRETFGEVALRAKETSHVPSTDRCGSQAWPPEKDELLIDARQRGHNWRPIAEKYFPDKTANACRKRHERLMEKKAFLISDGITGGFHRHS